jgi:hypothetical protein
MASTFPTVDSSRSRLHRAGWSTGETATAWGWLGSGSNGDNAITAIGKTQVEASGGQAKDLPDNEAEITPGRRQVVIIFKKSTLEADRG